MSGQEAVIADGDAMGVASQIGQHVVWATKGRLGVDDPLLAKKWPQERVKAPSCSRDLSAPGKVS